MRTGTLAAGLMPTAGVAALAGAAGLAIAGTLVWAALSPEAQLFGSTLIAPRRPDEVALTFDDGPNPAATPRLLEVLARANVRATFFLIGEFVRQRPDLVRQIAAAGHIVGNHTMTHPWLAWQSERRVREELVGASAAIEDALGQPVRYFRAPHGARRPAVLRIAREMGMVPVQWNVMCMDWKETEAGSILRRAELGVERNRARGVATNLLLHDGGEQGLGASRMGTVEAVEQLLVYYPDLRFVGVDDWDD